MTISEAEGDMEMIEVEYRANELHQLLVKLFGTEGQLQSRFVSRESAPDSPDIATWMQREGERFYLYRGCLNGKKVELAVTELALEQFGVLEILRTVAVSDALVALAGHRTLIYVDDGLLRYRPVAAHHANAAPHREMARLPVATGRAS